MCSLLRDSSSLRQPPPGTRFALSSLVFGAGRMARLSPRFTGFRPGWAAPAGGDPAAPFTPPLGGFGLTFGLAAGRLGLAGGGRAEDAVNGGGDGIDRHHAVHAAE